MDMQNLFRIGHLLEGAGSDSAIISLSKTDLETLGLLNHEGHVSVTQIDKKTLEPIEVKVPAVVPHERTPGAMVVVGVARKALKKLLNGKPIEGMREPEEPPRPVSA